MKKQYEKPAMQVTYFEQPSMLQSSPDGVIGPGPHNQPAGSRGLDLFGDDSDDE